MLLAFDLDKTVVTDDHHLPDPVRSAVLAARGAGHLVTVLTGRPHAAAIPFVEALGVRELYSVNHGALVIGRGGEVLQHRRLEPREVHALVHEVHERRDVEYSAVVGDALYVRDADDGRWGWAHTQNRRVETWRRDLDLAAEKVVFDAGDARIELAEVVRSRHPELVTYTWGDGYLEVTPSASDKGSALALLARELGVAREDVVAFGDGTNDVSMLAWAGRSVAVGPHAHPDVLAVADERIPSPEEGGVAEWLERELGVRAPAVR